MRIGVSGPFNPNTIKDFLEDVNLPVINVEATAVNTLVREFLLEGHSLTIFTLSYSNPQNYRVLKGKNVVIHLVPTGLIPKVFGSHQMVVGPLFLPKRIASIIGKHLNEIDVLHAHWTYEYAKAVSFFSHKIPVFDTVRDWCPYQRTLMKGRYRIDWELKYFLFKQVMSDDRITFIANSPYTQSMINGSYPQKKAPIIPNPIDKSWIIEKKNNVSKHQIISIATGLCAPRKNIGKLVEAFNLYHETFPESKLHLVGGYEKGSPVYQEWEKKGWLTDVVFHGSLPHEQLAGLLDTMTFMVHPALEETFGNILLEAMSRGVPCIGGINSGAVPQVLGNGQFGLVCDISDSESILKSMMEINKVETYERIQKQATNMLKLSYSSDVVVQKHIALFQSVINQKER